MKTIKYQDYTCRLEIGHYENENIAVQLFEVGTEIPVCTATINLGDLLPDKYAYIKNYSENTGLLEALVAGGFIEDIVLYKKTGYVEFPLVKLNLEGAMKNEK